MLDSLYGRARYASRTSARRRSCPRPSTASTFARAPSAAAGAGQVVPFDLGWTRGERTLLVSGPNTGGKTVLLKAMGLISLLAQSGVAPPVGPDSRCRSSRGVRRHRRRAAHRGEPFDVQRAPEEPRASSRGAGREPWCSSTRRAAAPTRWRAARWRRRCWWSSRAAARFTMATTHLGAAQAAGDRGPGRRQRLAAVRRRAPGAHVPTGEGRPGPLLRLWRSRDGWGCRRRCSRRAEAALPTGRARRGRLLASWRREAKGGGSKQTTAALERSRARTARSARSARNGVKRREREIDAERARPRSRRATC